MDYELALALKRAGFPQERVKKAYCLECEKWKEMDCFNSRHRTDFIYIPPLEELVEACGDRFITLTNDRSEKNKFWAEGHIGGIGDFVMPEEIIECSGLTPSEALVNLWLELNKK